MTITTDSKTYPSADYTSGPTFSTIDIIGGIVATVMLLLPLTAGGYHYNNAGWDAVQTGSQK